MRGILSVLCVTIALAATGCMSSVQAGMGTLCQGIELEFLADENVHKAESS